MAKYKSKPVIIEAEQFFQDKPLPFRDRCAVRFDGFGLGLGWYVETMHNGQMVAIEDGDWIVPEPDGEHFYPIKDEVFRNKYELIEEETEE